MTKDEINEIIMKEVIEKCKAHFEEEQNKPFESKEKEYSNEEIEFNKEILKYMKERAKELGYEEEQ